jgi:hypothetical protein
MVKAKSIAKSSAKSPGRAASGGEGISSTIAIQPELHVLAVELRCALSGITVAVHALRDQNADIDSDVAVVLQKAVGGPLHAALEKLESLLGASNHGNKAHRRPPLTGRVH